MNTYLIIAVVCILALVALRMVVAHSSQHAPVKVVVSTGAPSTPRHRAADVPDAQPGVTVFVSEERIASYMATHRRDVFRSTPEVDPELGRGYLVTHYAPVNDF